MFESYIIDSDFLVNYDLKGKENKLNAEEEEDNKLKCYPVRGSNKTPYQKIEFQIQKEPHWPPITPQTQTNNTNSNISSNANANGNVVGGGGSGGDVACVPNVIPHAASVKTKIVVSVENENNAGSGEANTTTTTTTTAVGLNKFIFNSLSNKSNPNRNGNFVASVNNRKPLDEIEMKDADPMSRVQFLGSTGAADNKMALDKLTHM